jgi:hypothetical protein
MAARNHYGGILGSIRELGDQITGGGLRSLAKRTRALGDRITGGGLRSLTKRSVATLVRWVMRRPATSAVGRIVLKPFPTFTADLYRLATTQSAPPPDSPPTKLVPSDTSVELATLPASARPIYRRLKAAMSRYALAPERGSRQT